MSLFSSNVVMLLDPFLITLMLKSFCGASSQACYEGGKEVVVIPKTSASSDSPWMGLAKYAWSGYVVAE